MNEQIILGLSIGISSGLVTTLLIWIITIVWVKKLVPWYETTVYKGVKIQGVWNLDTTEETDDPWTHSESLSLAQKAHRITGAATLTNRKETDSSPTSLLVYGEISDRIVSLNMRSPLSDRLSYSSLLLEVVGDGTVMRGESTFYNTETSKIESSPVVYKKSA